MAGHTGGIVQARFLVRGTHKQVQQNLGGSRMISQHRRLQQEYQRSERVPGSLRLSGIVVCSLAEYSLDLFPLSPAHQIVGPYKRRHRHRKADCLRPLLQTSQSLWTPTKISTQARPKEESIDPCD